MGKQPAVSVSESHFISLKLSYSSSTNSSPLREEHPVSLGMGAVWRSPGTWAHSLHRAAAAHGPFTVAFSTSLQACWHLIVQDVPGFGGPAVMLSLPNRASMAPYLRESSTCGKLVSLPTSFSLLLFSLLSHPNAASATTTASHIQTPHQRQRVGWPVTLSEEPQVRPPHSYPSGHQSSFSPRTRCGFFAQQRPEAMASAHGSQVLSSPLPQVSSAQLCTTPAGGGVSIRNATRVGRALGNTIALRLRNSMAEQAPRKPRLLFEMVLGFSLSGC